MNIALVTPWFGSNLVGGAERLAWELATGLRERDHEVVVYTTCGESFPKPWNRNFYKPGRSDVDDVPVLRFPVNRTSQAKFRTVNRKLLATRPDQLKPNCSVLDDAESEAFVRENIGSVALLSDLEFEAEYFDAVLFLPYLYGTTLLGWSAVRDRAMIVPCLHNEPYAYLDPVAEMFRGAARLLFNSRGEYELARRIFGPGIDPRSHVVGCGITWPSASGASTNPDSIAGFSPERERYVLYLGRCDEGKNVGLLTEAYHRFRELDPTSELKLAVAGEGSERIRSDGANLVTLGRVSDIDKERLLRHCAALMQPSTNESFSRVMMEAFALGRPVVAHRDCAVTSWAIDETTAGWQAGDITEWQRAFHAIASLDSRELAQIGTRAANYVREHASWERVLDRYEAVLNEFVEERERAVSAPKPRVVQRLHDASYGESITTFALQLDEVLRRSGVDSLVVARRVQHPLSNVVVAHLDDAPIEDRIELAYAVTPSVAQARSAEGATFLRLDPFVDAGRWNIEPDRVLMAGLQDGRCNILSVAPVEPASHLLETIDVFAQYLSFDFGARLSLVGPIVDEAYASIVRDRIQGLALEHRIMLPGVVAHATLAAFYRTARVFVSCRERYKTGLSLAEAMMFDIPICATANDDTRAILNGSGVLVSAGAKPLELAALWRVLATDAETRARVIVNQRQHRAVAGAEGVVDRVMAIL